MNPLPVTSKLKAAEPMLAEEGRIVLTAGAGLAVIVKTIPDDVPPPGAGLVTVTVAVPTMETSPAVMAALNCVVLMKVVTRFDPFHCTCEEGMNPLPLTESVTAPVLLIVETGRMEVSAGTGFEVIVKDDTLEIPPLGAGFQT